jgi:hypothetical protein
MKYLLAALMVANLIGVGVVYAKAQDTNVTVNALPAPPSSDDITNAVTSAIPTDIATQSDVDLACIR